MGNSNKVGEENVVNIETVRIASDYSRFPSGRYHSDGPGNGEDFREKYLVPALETNYGLKIVLDGTLGNPSSYLEEAFGGLVRKGYSVDKIKQTFEIVAEDEEYKECNGKINGFLIWANQ